MADPAVNYLPPDTHSDPLAAQQKIRVEQALKNRASWFLVIAGLSILNSVLSMSGTSLHFIFGLGLTQIVDELAHQAGTAGYALDFIINGIIAGALVLIWNFARKGQGWAWYVGMGLYAIDGLLLLLFKDYLSVAFHAWALYRMSPGLKLLPILRRLDEAASTGSISSSF
jgi:hypothetical protein